MRADEFVRALSRSYEVHVYVFRPNSDPVVALRKLVYKISPKLFGNWFSRPREWTQFANIIAQFKLRGLIHQHYFEVVHVFKIFLIPIIQTCLAENQKSIIFQLGMDDIESIKVNRFHQVALKNLDRKFSLAMLHEQRKYSRIEKKFIPKFDQVFVCSEFDKEKISDLIHPQKIIIAPNIIRIPTTNIRPKSKRIFRFLFVGSLDYYPNRDGVLFFCHAVLPALKQRCARPFEVLVIGQNPSANFRRKIAQFSNVRILSNVRDLTPYYIYSDVIIVPIRAGSGTRIKILEAFAYRKPVIATTVGAEGLEAENGHHLLIADSALEFATQCHRLMGNPKLSELLTHHAYQLVIENYSPAVLDQIINNIKIENR